MANSRVHAAVVLQELVVGARVFLRRTEIMQLYKHKHAWHEANVRSCNMLQAVFMPLRLSIQLA